MRILGIDAGTNSLGWSIRDTEVINHQIIDFGVLTFEKGVASEKGNEFPKVKKRTESRGKRNNYRAEKYRKWDLLYFLIENNMCPLSHEELNKWKNYKKGTKRKYPQNDLFLNWLRFDFDGDGKPDFHLIGKNKHDSLFAFRALAVDTNFHSVYKTNSYLLGRIFYQLVQRRGFKGRDEEEAKTMLQGSDKNGTKGRDDIAEFIENHKTLGAALYYYQKETGERIRQRYNLRKDYEAELKLLCQLYDINDEDYQKLWKAIIWQRPLRTQKGLVGYCIYEKNKKRVQVSHPLYEEYRTWTFINNLKIIPPIGVDKQTYIQEKIYPLFFKSSNDFELKTILNQLKKDGGKIDSKFKEKTKVISAKLLKSFQDIFGDNWKELLHWDNINERDSQPSKKQNSSFNYDEIWHVLKTFDSQENLKDFALNKLNLDDEKAEKFSKIKLNQGYATMSLSAIKKILPFLRKGIPYHYAVFLANLYKVLGMETISDTMIDYFIEEFREVEKSNEQTRLLNTVVNSLVLDELNSKYRYSIENDRDLDDSEKKNINAKLIEIFGEKTWLLLSDDEKTASYDYVAKYYKEFLRKSVLSKTNLFMENERIHDQIFNVIAEKYDIPEDKKKFLWHPSEQENYTQAEEYDYFTLNGKPVYIKQIDRENFIKNNKDAEFQGRSLKLLGSPEPVTKGLKNPMALKTMHKMKQLINFLLQEGKIDEDTRIVIEIARELNDANRRKAIEKWNNEREKENLKFSETIIEINKECNTTFNPSDKMLLRKIRLWEEQNKTCLYTGKLIKLCDVLDGNKYDLEHTIPASISFDNELRNLTLTDTEFNRNIKKKQYPSQLYNHVDILNNIQFMKEKIEHLEDLYKEWKNKASYASTKEIKDNCIQRYHFIKMDLDYWSYKYNTFILEEYKSGWKNSQLRDTQIITKYALPYLKTLFKRVSVEKASVVNVFKEVYNVKLLSDKKNRSTHSHHAGDASILTLIPSAFDRERILKLYNEEKDNHTGKIYHEQPKDWKDFSPSYIKEIENVILINNIVENRTTVPTYKVVRKKGKIVWEDKSLDKKRIAQGDTIRGQLHDESLYGAIKLPLRNEENKILFDDNGKMKLTEEPILVIRKDLVYKQNADSPGFKTLEEVEKVIVDKALFEMIKMQVEDAVGFKEALTKGVWMFDKQGNKVNKIRRIRCKGSMKYNTALKVHTHAFTSKFDYKKTTLAKSGENALCLFYKNEDGKAMEILSISDVAQLKFKNDRSYFLEPEYNTKSIGKGKKSKEIPLYAVLRSGQKVLFYKDSIEELKELDNSDLTKRLYKVYQFESDGRMKFRNHMAAGIDTDLKKENKEGASFNFENPSIFLRIRQGEWNFAIDGVDFEMKMDGSLKFK